MSLPTKHFHEFGAFRLDARDHLLLRDGELVTLPPKTLDVLLVLVENRGRVVSKEELMQLVWPDSFVEEANLSRHVFILRKALGEDGEGKYIETIPRRGYRFVASVAELRDESDELVVAEHSRSRIVIEQMESPSIKTHQSRSDAPALALGAGTRRRTSSLVLASAAVVLALAAGIYFWKAANPRLEQPPTGVKSIAVLPFKPLVAQSRNESLEIGMADTLITKLSNIKQLVVRPTSAIRKYTGLDQDALAAGRELGVDYVLEGNLQMEGEKTRATVRLLSVRDGSALWTDKCDQACSTIFELQDSVAQQIAGRLAIELTGDEKKQLAKHYTENTEAYQLALRGRFYWSKWTPAAWKKSIEFYHQALEKDPRYALAYAWMAATYNVQANIAVVPPKEAYTKAKELAEKALEIDDGLADGHYVMAALKMFYEWDWPGAERELERAIALNPQDAEGRLLHSYYSMITGHPDESLTKVKRCEELNPISPFISTNVADMLYFARHYDEAIEQYRKTLDLDPNHSDARRGLAMAYVEKGMHQESILMMNKSIELDGDNKETSPSLGYIYALAGNKTGARVIANNLERLSKHGYYDPIKIAYIYAALGEKDRAFEWLEKAYDERSVGMQWINVTPRLDNLRADPRFASLQRRIGLPV